MLKNQINIDFHHHLKQSRNNFHEWSVKHVIVSKIDKMTNFLFKLLKFTYEIKLDQIAYSRFHIVLVLFNQIAKVELLYQIAMVKLQLMDPKLDNYLFFDFELDRQSL
jgi:hypothetical protein